MHTLRLKRNICFHLRSKFSVYGNFKSSILSNKFLENFNKTSQTLYVCPSNHCKGFASNVGNSKEINKELFVNNIINMFSSKNEDFLLKSNSLPVNVSNNIQECIKQIISCKNDIEELESIEKNESDSNLKNLIKEEFQELQDKVSTLKEEIFNDLMDNFTFQNVEEFYLEITAGVGGQEAMLFTQNLMNMYYGYCALNGWSSEIVSYEDTPLGGIRHVCMVVKGHNSYSKLKFEGGIHRVQRVPKTEKAGRIHTSTVSVAILPVPKEVNIRLSEKDLKFEFTRASGPGGQNVNKSNSAVRLTHLPTGIVVTCQAGRSQETNKKEALRKLKALLYEIDTEKQTSETFTQRKLQTGTKARSEKIRTYNFVQDRVTDHRIGISIHNIEDVMAGNSLEKLTTELMKIGKLEKLREVLNIRDE